MMRRAVLLLAVVNTCIGTSVFFVDDDDQTLSFPIQRGGVRHFENDILDVLDLEEPPEGTISQSLAYRNLADYMSRLYRNLEEDGHTNTRKTSTFDMDINDAEMAIALSPKEVTPEYGDVSWRLQFDFSDILREGCLSSAQLRFVTSRKMASRIKKLDIYRETSMGEISVLSSWSPSPRVSLPVPFNITQLAANCLLSPTSPCQLLLNIHTNGNKATVDVADWQAIAILTFHNVPRREVHGRRRSRRSVSEDVPSPPVLNTPSRNPFKPHANVRRAACRRHGLYVDFKDMGWKSWVISPEGYQAHYCSGACSFPLNAHMNSTNHAIIQTLIHLVDNATPAAKCAPLRLSQMSILFFDPHNHVILKRYKDMIIQDCGCQ